MHYYHYKYDEVMMLDIPTYEFLIEAMNLAQSQRDLGIKELISYPHMDKDGRSKVDNRMRLSATTKEMRADSAITSDQLKVAGISIGNISDIVKGRNG
jgi:hypothetical protein